MTNLKELSRRVAEGDTENISCNDVPEGLAVGDFLDAVEGSIDSAVALLERALPGWVFSLSKDDTNEWEVELQLWSDDYTLIRQLYGYAKTPAATLVAALLLALDEEKGDE